MKYSKICKCCGKEFETNNPQKLYCDGEHYLPCPICGKPVLKKGNDFTVPPRCCSSKCAHEKRKLNLPKRKCIFCGKEFQPKSGVSLVCDDTHYQNCEICGKQIIRTIDTEANNVTTCSPECTKEKLRQRSLEKYGTEHPMQNAEVKQHFKDAMKAKYGVEHALQDRNISAKQQATAYETNMRNNGVPYACLLPQCMNAQGRIVSNPNKLFGDRLDDKGIAYSFERRIDNLSFDLCIEAQKTLIELNPSYTHSTIKNHWNQSVDKFYHKHKRDVAESNGYRCIHIFDWDDKSKIVDMLLPKQRIYARNCTVFKLKTDVANEFLQKYHLQGTCRGQLLCLGLVYQGELYQVMTFGKSRYDKTHAVELLRLCTKPGYTVVGGASKLFKFATQDYGLHDIISYCDLSKFSGKVYETLGMKLIRVTPPQEVWSRGTDKVTANLLRARGYDQLFNTQYGKGTSNEELMLRNGWLPVYDCGQAVYAYN